MSDHAAGFLGGDIEVHGAGLVFHADVGVDAEEIEHVGEDASGFLHGFLGRGLDRRRIPAGAFVAGLRRGFRTGFGVLFVFIESAVVRSGGGVVHGDGLEME